jgi:hypothetical protein
MKYAVTFEHDIKPPVTVRGESTKDDVDVVIRTAMRAAEKANPRYQWTSLCLVLEKPIKSRVR